MSEERRMFTLTQLNLSLEKLFFERFANEDFWITAELIKIGEKNDNWYLELADSKNETVTSRARATIWSFTYRAIATRIGWREIQGILKPGNMILIHVKIEYHKIYGLSLRVQDLDPNYSYGEIERKRKEVIQRLKKEGIFENQKKVHLPTIIKRILLIASPETSGYRDFKNELFNNHEFSNFKIREFPVRVQGEAAIDDIVTAIHEANLYDGEVIVIIRGGGSKMDLALFDDYKIAQAICLSRLPVLTGIGHENDEVVADLVAKQFFITPTAVGKHIQYEIKSFREIMRSYHDKILQRALQLVGENRHEFTHLNNYLTHFTMHLINSWQLVFQTYENEITSKSKTFLFRSKEELMEISHRTSLELNRLVQFQSTSLDKMINKLEGLVEQQIHREIDVNLNQTLTKIQLLSHQLIEKEQIKVTNLEELLQLLNPKKILASGYTITTINDEDLNHSTPQIGAEMKTLANEFLITSKITHIDKNKEFPTENRNDSVDKNED